MTERLSRVYIHIFHLDLRSETLHETLMLARKALSLDKADAWSHAAVVYAYLIGSQHNLAGLRLDRAAALSPDGCSNYVEVRLVAGFHRQRG